MSDVVLSETVLLVGTDHAEALADLADGAHRRLRDAAWTAKTACERISHNDADPFEEIDRAGRALTEARRHAQALAAYRNAAIRESQADGNG